MRSRALLVPGVVLGVACASLPVPVGLAPGGAEYSREELREEIADFSGYFHSLVGATADRIAEESEDRAVRRRALLWKMRAVPLVQEAAFDPNPQEAFVSLLTTMALMRDYLTQGDARELFGDQQALAIDVVERLDRELLEIGAQFLSPEELGEVRDGVDEFVRRRSIAGGDFSIQSVRGALEEVESTTAFGRVVDVPLAPFRALGGVGDTPAAIREFTAAARDFVRAVERLPEQARWQVELALYDFEDRETVVESVSAFRDFADSAERISERVEVLPADVRALLDESDEALVRLEQVLAQAGQVAVPLRDTARSVELASASWASLLEREGAPAGEAGEGFDVAAWESAVRELGRTAVELRELAVELRGLAGDGELPQVAATVGLADSTARGWIDQAAWRGLLLILAFFVLLLAYRLVVARLAPL